ncbi:hypothetical protein [Phycicoccus sp. 3266]|uniref:hypothetical protein n=1 Tax=Phycicoccus sp. 3266 TaxID=2817751 RepID=UPI00285B9CC5|nr:hypothetical protein [Phycicoccus sp. 3266]MDR6862165.1 hypothetical protein [Phycicoccus sp. 3266]
MTEAPVGRPIADARELLGHVTLRDILFYRVDAERLEDDAAPEGDERDEADTSFAIQERHGPEVMEVRCRLDWAARGGRYTIDAAAQYDFDEPLDLSAEVVREFVERVGVMAVYPFIREALHQAASRLRLDAPILGLLQAGSVRVTDDPPAVADSTLPPELNA